MNSGTINIVVKKTGALKKPQDPAEERITIKTDSTVDMLLDALKFEANHKKFINVSVNNKSANRWTVLKDGDEVVLFLPVGGG
ncbi:MAG: MoaD/ThiS family protein [Thermoplasmata archaeon]